MLGEKVVLAGNASLDVSGAAGGGAIRVGGDWHGANALVQNAQSTFVGSDVNLKADAGVQGDGGKIVVWSDGDTRYFGKLSAQGGANGGDGGSAEVSGKGSLIFNGGANLGAAKGKAGNLLLDPLDLYIDSAGGLNPSIIDESTDFPDNAVTVSPATLEAIVGNVTLYASHDMRFNSAVALTGASQGLTASAGNDLQIGASITTSGGAVSLAAGRNVQIGAGITTSGGAVSLAAGGNLTAFAASPIATAGGNVTLSAQTISAAPLSIAAGAGSAGATTSVGGLTLGAVAGGSVAMTSAGSVNVGPVTSVGALSLASLGGSETVASVSAAGAVTLNSAAGLSVGTIDTGGGNLTLAGASGISAAAITTHGGNLSATSTGGGLSDVSTIDTRAAAGPDGGVSIQAAATTNTGSIRAGSADISISGSDLSSTGAALDTTGNVFLTASAGSISNFTVNNANSITASATNNADRSDASVTLYSDFVLNATAISANTTHCTSSSDCNGAMVSLTGAEGVNVGTVTANAPATTYSGWTPQYQVRYRSVTIDGGNGPILAMSPASQITATDVSLQTNQYSGSGIGSVALPINVDAERNLTLKPNGDFSVVLNGSGPIQLDIQPGVAASGTYAGTLTKSGQIDLSLMADDTTVTASNFAITGGFDTMVYRAWPSISLSVPNGSLVASNVAVPKGDQVGFANTTEGPTGIIDMSVNLSADNNLTVGSFTREAGAYPKSTTFAAANGNVTIGSVAANADDVVVTSNAGSILATSDTSAVEIASTGNISLTAKSIGTAGFAHPLDLAGGTINLTSTDAAGYIGSSGAANPVTAATTMLTVDAAGKFNVDTLATDLYNLTVRASPTGVGSAGMAQVTSGSADRTIYGFASDGTGFTLGSAIPGHWGAPATQFAGGGTLDFTAKSGNVTLDGINFAASGGNLTVRANQPATGAITQTGGSELDLGSGILTLRADGPVVLDAANLGGLSASNASSNANGCLFGYLCGVGSFTSSALTDPALPNPTTFTVVSRGPISTGDLAADNINFTAYSGGIATGNISGLTGAATSVTLRTDSGLGGDIRTTTIEAGSTTLQAAGDVVTGTINAAHPNAGRVYISTQGGNITTASIDANSVQLYANGGSSIINVGDINAFAPNPNDITINADTSITTGSLDAQSISIGGNCCTTYPSISTGAIGSHLPGYSLSISGSSINIGGPINLDSDTYGETLNLYAQTGDITIAGNITTGQGGDQYNPMTLDADAGQLKINGGNGAISTLDGSYLSLHAGNTSTANPFTFAIIDAGPTGGVTVDAPAGIEQTGYGITAGTVALRATSPGATIKSGGSSLTLHETTDLTIEAGGAVNIQLTGAEGVAPELTNLDITRSDSSAPFRLDDGNSNQLSSTQSLSVTAAEGGGVSLYLNSGETDTGFTNFRYHNTDSSGSNAGDIYGQGIYSNGGRIKLVSDSGGISTGNIDSRDGWGNGGRISLHAYAGIDVSDEVNAGNGAIRLKVDSGNISSSGYGFLSADSVHASAGSGDIGSSGRWLDISANSVKLYSTTAGEGAGGNVYANLSETSRVKINADNGFDVTSDTSLSSLSITTRGDGSGDTSISAAGQNFDILRNGSGIDVGAMTSPGFGAVTSATPLDKFSLTVTSGDIHVYGTGANSVAADSLSFHADGNLILDGSDSPLVLSNVRQNFTATNDLTLSGAASISASGAQSFSAGRDLSVTAGAGGGETISISNTGSGDQMFSAARNLTLTGGSSSNETLSVSNTGGGNQSFTSQNGNIALSGGSGDGATLSVVNAGGGNQSFTSQNGNIALSGGSGSGATLSVSNAEGGNQTFTSQNGNISISGGGDSSWVDISTSGGTQTLTASGEGSQIILTGGGVEETAGAFVHLAQNSDGGQLLTATGGITFTGGDSDGSYVAVQNNGSGRQQIGEAFWFANTTPSVTLQGGTGTGSYVLLQSAGEQWVTPVVSISVLGGSGDGSYALINGTQTGNYGQNQLIGHPGWTYTDQSPYSPYISGDYRYDTPSSITVTAGSGSNAYAEISASGQQSVYSTGTITLTGSAADGAYARITGAGQDIRSGDMLSLLAGSGDGADALIVSSGANLQYIAAGSLTLTAGGDGAYLKSASARIVSGGDQQFGDAWAETSVGDTVLTAGSGPNSVAEIFATGSQNLTFGDLTLRGGSGDGAAASIASDATQTISANTVALAGGSTRGADAFITAASDQTINAGDTSLTGGSGTAAGDARAYITNSAGVQYLSVSDLHVTSGADYGAATISTQGSAQTIYANDISVAAGEGANNGGPVFASIDSAGTQAISANSVEVNNQYAPGMLRIHSAGAQSISTWGAISVLASAGDAQIDSGATQSISASSGSLTIQALGGSGSARVTTPGAQTISTWGAIDVQASTGDAEIGSGATQIISASNGSLRIQALGGSGSASVTTPAAQSIETRYVEVSTQSGATGNAELTAGSQLIHTTNGSAGANGSLYVAALGSGTAQIVSGGGQVLEIDYPELMQGSRDGRITVGDAGATGHSLISAVDQDVFARSITVLGGSGSGATAEINVSGVQTVSLVSSTATSGAGLTLLGGSGSGSSALIDPAIQNIVSNGDISVTGGSGSGSVGGIIGSGDQTVLVTSGGANSIDVMGGGGASAFGQITTTGYIQRMGTSGGIVLNPGGGANGDAIIGASGANSQSLVVCSTGSCSFASIASNPFINPATEVGVFANPITGQLSDVTVATGGAPPPGTTSTLPIDITSLLLWNPTLEMSEDDTDNYFWRRWPVCR